MALGTVSFAIAVMTALIAGANITRCQNENCAHERDTCQTNEGCQTIVRCISTCQSGSNGQGCRDRCIASVSQSSRILWSEQFFCALNAGCFDTHLGIFGGYSSAEETVDRWAERNGCTEFVDLDPIDMDRNVAGKETLQTIYLSCNQNTNVRLARMERSSHSPGLLPLFGMSLVEWILDNPRTD